MIIEFGTLNFNNLVLLVIALVGLINTIVTVMAARSAKASTQLAIETRNLAIKSEEHTKVLVAKVLHENGKIAKLLDDTLNTVVRKDLK